MEVKTDAVKTIFTIGYEDHKQPGDLVAKLKEAGIELLVDVRAIAHSRRPGFSRRALSEVLSDAGIFYEHWPELGNPKEYRDLYKSGAVLEGRRAFQAHLRNGSSTDVDRLAERISTTSACVMCLEADHEACHRAVVAEEVVERHVGAAIVHL